MNACLVAYTFYEVDYRVRRYAEALAEEGSRVDAIVLRRQDQEPMGVLKGVTIHRIQKRSYNEKNILDYSVKILLFFVKGSIVLLRLHLKHGYRVIHIHNVPDFLVFMAFIPKLLKAKVILDIHDILPELYCEKFKKNMNSILAKVMLLVEKMSTRFADHVITANDLWRQKIISRDMISPQSCTSLINYPKLELFQKSVSHSNNDQLKIIYPGTISHHHGLDIAMRALATVKRKIPSVTLDIYTGSNNLGYFKSLQSLVDDLGLRENVNFHDPVPLEELAKILSAADLGIITKRSGLFADEAMSTKALDYMAAGIPVITSDTEIERYYFDDSMVMFYEPEDYQGLAECIVELYRDLEKRKLLVKNSKEFVARNNWDLKKEAYYRIVEDLTRLRLKKSERVARRIYLSLKPIIPRRVQIKLRSEVVLRKRRKFKDIWPVNAKAARPPSGWSGWPDGKKFAVVLTHDVETAKGRYRCVDLVALEERLGFRSSFNFVPKGYDVPNELRSYLIERGFEVGVHGLYHDRNHFENRSMFSKMAPEINRYMEEWQCVGFRSPSMYHNLEWIGELNTEYDASTFDTDPFEPQPDGVATIFPFLVPRHRYDLSTCNQQPERGDSKGVMPTPALNNCSTATLDSYFVELPYTLPQDFTLFILMKERDISIWKQKLNWIAEKGGMALVITHPDYMSFTNRRTAEEYPSRLYEEFLEYIASRYQGQYWHVLPREMARFWHREFCVTQKAASFPLDSSSGVT